MREKQPNRCDPDSLIFWIISDGSSDIGCAGDVLRAMDQLCSGRQQCSIPVIYFDSFVSGCTPDRYKFLQAEYVCVAGDVTRSSWHCGWFELLTFQCDVLVAVGEYLDCTNATFSDASGFIDASHAMTSLNTQPGSSACPWRIVALPGQQVQLQLVDVSLSSALKNHNYADECPVTLVTVETIATNEKRYDYALCGRAGRIREVLTSSSHAIDLYVTSRSDWFVEDTPIVMLHYTGETKQQKQQLSSKQTTMSRSVIKRKSR